MRSSRYRIERELGHGGMATVYLAHDLRHNRRVAIKVLRSDIGEQIGAARFHEEIRTTATLQHPHILPLFDSGEADNRLFYVMPLIEGESLRDRLERDRVLPVDMALSIATDVAGALDYAHRQGESSIAISSPRTSCCWAGTRWWPTSASDSPWSWSRTRRSPSSWPATRSGPRATRVPRSS